MDSVLWGAGWIGAAGADRVARRGRCTGGGDRAAGRGVETDRDGVAQALRRGRGLQPWRSETFKFSTDPELETKVRDVVGLYLNPPENAVVLSVNEKSQVQALDRTAGVS